MTTSFEKWVVISVVILNTYSLGANCVERFVNYESWPRLAEANFGPYHRSQQPFILGFVVGPMALALPLDVLLLFNRPQQVQSWVIWTQIGALVAGFVSTVAIQIPIHRQLDSGYSELLVARLLNTDWLRKSMDLVRLLATIVLLRCCLT